MGLRIKRHSAIFTLVLMGLASGSQADPASEGAIIAKLGDQIRQLQKQYRLMNKTYTNAESQLKSINKLSNYHSGHYGFGRLNNSVNELTQRQSANSWRDTLKGISGGNPDRYRELVSAYERQHADLNKAQFSKGASAARTLRFESERQAIQAASVESETSFNDINERMKRIHTLSEEIEKAENTKAAVDLNSRLLTEIAYLQAENLKAQAILNQQLAMSAGSNLSDDAEWARFLTLDSNGKE